MDHDLSSLRSDLGFWRNGWTQVVLIIVPCFLFKFDLSHLSCLFWHNGIHSLLGPPYITVEVTETPIYRTSVREEREKVGNFHRDGTETGETHHRLREPSWSERTNRVVFRGPPEWTGELSAQEGVLLVTPAEPSIYVEPHVLTSVGVTLVQLSPSRPCTLAVPGAKGNMLWQRTWVKIWYYNDGWDQSRVRYDKHYGVQTPIDIHTF